MPENPDDLPGPHLRQLSPPLSGTTCVVTQTGRDPDPTHSGAAMRDAALDADAAWLLDGVGGRAAGGGLASHHQQLDSPRPPAGGAHRGAPPHPSRRPRRRPDPRPVRRGGAGLAAGPAARRKATARCGTRRCWSGSAGSGSVSRDCRADRAARWTGPRSRRPRHPSHLVGPRAAVCGAPALLFASVICRF